MSDPLFLYNTMYSLFLNVEEFPKNILELGEVGRGLWLLQAAVVVTYLEHAYKTV